MPVLTLSALDWLVIGLFFAAVLALGFSAKLRENTVLQYLVAGRNLSVPAFVATLVCTWYGGILGVGESVKYYGAGAWLLIGVPYYVFGLAYAVWLAPRVRSAEQISIPERLALRWGKANAVLAALLIFLLAIPAAHVLMLGALIQQITGLDRSIAVPVAAIAGVALLFRGGLLADVRVAVLAFGMMYFGFAVMAVFCFVNFPGAIGTIADQQLLTFTGGQPWTVVVSFFILGAWTVVDPAFHQRVASAASPAAGRKGLIFSVLFWFIFDLLSISTALYALALVDPNLDKLAIYPALAERVLPAGAKGLFLCGIAGTVATAMVSYTLVSGATVGREFVSRLFGPYPDATTNKIIKISLLLAIGIAVPLGLTLNSVVDLWYAWAGVSVGALLLPMIFAYRTEASRIRPRWVFASMLVAGASSMSWLIYCQRTNNLYYEVVLLNLGNGWKLTLPPVPENLQGQATSFSLGTLLPGLVISALILSTGWFAGRKKHDG